MSVKTYVLYSGYNLRGAISVNHQNSHLEVIFTIIKFVNHSMVLRFAWPDQFTRLKLIDISIISTGCNTCHEISSEFIHS